MARKKRQNKNQRKDGRYMVRLELGVKPNGNRDIKYFYGATAEEANKKKSEYVKRHSPAAAFADRDITLEQWASRWLATYKSNKSKSTRANYQAAINGVCKYSYAGRNGAIRLGEMRMTDILPYHLQSYVSSLNGRSKSTIRCHIMTLRKLFEVAADNGLIQPISLRSLDPPAGSYVGHRCIEAWEKDLINATWREHRCGVWAMLMLHTGMRRQEMAALTWDDIDLAGGEISIQAAVDFADGAKLKTTKTVAGLRKVPLFLPLMAALKEVKPAKASGRVCLSAKGKPLSQSAYQRGWEGYMCMLERAANGLQPYGHTEGWRKDKARKREGHVIVDIDAHDLRYTFATMLYDADVDVKTAQRLLGHTDLNTTMKIYTQLSEKKNQASLEKLREYVEAPQTQPLARQNFDTHFDTQAP